MPINITYSTSSLSNSIQIQHTEPGMYYKYVYNNPISLVKNVKYTIEFRIISDVITPLHLYVTKSIGDDAFIYDSSFGKYVDSVETLPNTIEDKSYIITPISDGTGSLEFLFLEGTYHISDIRIRPYYTNSENPGVSVLTIPNPIQNRKEEISIRSVFIDTSNKEVTKGISTAYSEYTNYVGNNLVISRDDNLIEGSLFVGSSLYSGIEIAGISSAYIRSIGYTGFTSASNGSGGPGFMIWSGSVLTASGDNYSGVGIDMVLSSSNYFRFRTNPSELDIRTDSIFIGNPNTNYISASGGTLEISSSNFLLSSSGDVIVSGEINAESGIIAGLYIKSASIQNSPLNAESTILFGSASYYYNATDFSDRLLETVKLIGGGSGPTLGITELIHDSDLYGDVGPPSNPATAYYIDNPTYLNIDLSSSAAYHDLYTNSNSGFLRLFIGSNTPDVVYTSYTDIYSDSMLSISTGISFWLNDESITYGACNLTMQFLYDNDTVADTNIFSIMPIGGAKNDFEYMEFKKDVFVPNGATKFKFWFDFYRFQDPSEDYTSNYKLHHFTVTSERELLEISPSGFFYRANANKFIKLGMGHYEIKGTDIESDILSVSERIKIGSGSYRSGLLNINQYSPMSSSAINLSYKDTDSYMWLDANNVMNFKSGVSSQLYYYKFFGNNNELFSIYRNAMVGSGVRLLYNGVASNMWVNGAGVTNLSTSGSDNIHYNFLVDSSILASIYDNPTTGSGIILYKDSGYSRMTCDPSIYTNYHTFGSADYIHRFYKDDLEILSLRDKTDTGSLLDMYGSIAIQGHHVSLISIDGTFTSPSHHALASQQAIKDYVDYKFELVSSLDPGTGGTGATGYITRWAGTDTLTTANIFQNTINNYIGFNTTDPKVMCHVNGDVSSSNVSTSGNVNAVNGNFSGNVGAVNGTFSGTVMANTITETSDERLKFNIRPLENQLDNVELLSPKRFNFIKNPGEAEIGLIAQDVQKIYPEFVNEINGVYSIEYSKLTVVLIQALKEMQDENTALKNRLGDLEKKVDVLLNFLNK